MLFIGIACLIFAVSMLVVIVLEVRRERQAPPLATMESGSNHLREGRRAVAAEAARSNRRADGS